MLPSVADRHASQSTMAARRSGEVAVSRTPRSAREDAAK
jgi:hypothetical protein